MQTLPESSPLTARERYVIAVTAAVVALSRLLAISASLWDWDEALFFSAIRDFDVTQHHPHPPGFPLYVAGAKLLALVLPDFRAYQALNVVASMALFPLVYYLAREMGFHRAVAYCGALTYVFLPNVWFYGGTAFSDITGTALVLLAAFLLLRGRTDRRAFLAGALVLGMAAGVRSQALLIGCVPALAATVQQWRSSRRRVFVAIACGAAVVALCYGIAALASASVDGYFATSAGLKEYLARVDSYLSPIRPPLTTLFADYFVEPFRGGRVGRMLAYLAGIGLGLGITRRDRAVLMAAATFLPFALFAWLMLDFNSISRYSVAYVAVFALLAAQVPMLLPRVREWRHAGWVVALLMLPFAARLAGWTMPALREARTTLAPTEASLRWLESNLGGRPLYVHGSMGPFVEARLPRLGFTLVDDRTSLEDAGVTTDSMFLIEETTLAAHGTRFVRERARLWDIVRRRYFEVSLLPATEAVGFGDGWYGLEGEGTAAWRWMQLRSTATLPPIEMPAELTLKLAPPDGHLAHVTVEVDGRPVGRFTCADITTQKWLVPSNGKAPRVLVITSDVAVNPGKLGVSGDTRDLALRLEAIGWVPAAGR